MARWIKLRTVCYYFRVRSGNSRWPNLKPMSTTNRAEHGLTVAQRNVNGKVSLSFTVMISFSVVKHSKINRRALEWTSRHSEQYKRLTFMLKRAVAGVVSNFTTSFTISQSAHLHANREARTSACPTPSHLPVTKP